MTDDQSKLPQEARTESSSLPTPQQLSGSERLQEEELRQKEIREIRKSYIVHGKTISSTGLDSKGSAHI